MHMSELLVITAIGEDRPGIVDELTRTLLEHELNIADSRMSVLGGEFALILLVSGKLDALQAIQQQSAQLEQSLNLKLLFKLTRGKTDNGQSHSYQLSVEGMDNPGIVHRLSRFLSERQINIEDLQTSSYPAAHTGTPMFAVKMTVEIPASVANEQLREDFMELCDEQNLDAEFKETTSKTND